MKPIVLVILDGWGLSPDLTGNAIYNTPTPNYDKLLSIFPSTTLHASGEEVGLTWGEMGNSEVGHLNLGTGRVVMQDLPRINKSIQDGSFFHNLELRQAFKYARENQSKVHLIGLFSGGGVHSHLNHLFALLEMAKRESPPKGGIFIHLISDGRDTPPKIILQDLPKLEEKLREVGFGQIASLCGRYYAMDRDRRLERTKKAFRVLIDPSAPAAPKVEEAVSAAYVAGKSDEFIEPIRIGSGTQIQKKDAVIFYNFRPDRSRQLSELILQIPEIYFVSFTSYGEETTPLIKVAFFADRVTDQLAMVLANKKLSQLHIAETEKYPHVTYFFNGGWERPFAGENRILIPSPQVETYDLKPEMSAKVVAEKFCQFFAAKKPVFSVLNFANPDMVGHTGVYEAAQKAIAAVDEQLGKVAGAVIQSDSDIIITADHGNAEQMINPQTQEPDKNHTTNPVPMILGFSDKKYREPLVINMESKITQASVNPSGVLADVTATILGRLGLSQPEAESGQNLSDSI